MFRVVIFRKKFRVGYGDSEKEPLKMAISAHSNAVENIPLALVMMLLLELNSANSALLITFGGVLLFARIIHAKGLSQSVGVSFGRTYGTMISWISVIAMAVFNLYYSLI